MNVQYIFKAKSIIRQESMPLLNSNMKDFLKDFALYKLIGQANSWHWQTDGCLVSLIWLHIKA